MQFKPEYILFAEGVIVRRGFNKRHLLIDAENLKLLGFDAYVELAE